MFVNNGEVFRLGIPLTVSSTPIEVTGGYRFHLRRSRIIPCGHGHRVVSYRETSDFSRRRGRGRPARGLHRGRRRRVPRHPVDCGDRDAGTRVPGILGQSGLSKDVNEDNFGGIAARLRVVVGR